MSVSTYKPDSTKILHTAYADFVSRQIGRPVHVVQYDDGLPILAVKLFQDGQPYTIPENADVNIKLKKSDGTFVCNSALGCNLVRTIVYFEITYQMVVLAGEISPVVEIGIGDALAASSSIGIVIDRNPVQSETIKSTSEWKAIQQSVEYAKEAISAAAQASASRSASYVSEHNARVSENNASYSADMAVQKAEEATCSAVAAESFAHGGTGTRTGEDTDNAMAYAQEAKEYSERWRAYEVTQAEYDALLAGGEIKKDHTYYIKDGENLLPDSDLEVDNALSSISENPVQNKVIKAELDKKVSSESPVFTGSPTAPTPVTSSNSTRIATTAFVKAVIDNLINGAPEALDTLKEIADAISENETVIAAINAASGNKVDKVPGKGLSTNDFTTALKNKLSGIEEVVTRELTQYEYDALPDTKNSNGIIYFIKD